MTVVSELLAIASILSKLYRNSFSHGWNAGSVSYLCLLENISYISDCSQCWCQAGHTSHQFDVDAVSTKLGTLMLKTSDGLIQIMLWFKSWLNHIWWLDSNTRRFDLESRDLICIWFKFNMIWSPVSARSWMWCSTTFADNYGIKKANSIPQTHI